MFFQGASVSVSKCRLWYFTVELATMNFNKTSNSGFSQTHKIGNLGIIVNFVFPCLQFSFLFVPYDVSKFENRFQSTPFLKVQPKRNCQCLHKEIFFDNMFTLHAYAFEDEFYSVNTSWQCMISTYWPVLISQMHQMSKLSRSIFTM